MIFEFIKDNLKKLSPNEAEIIKDMLNGENNKSSKKHETLTEDELDFLQKVLTKMNRD